MRKILLTGAVVLVGGGAYAMDGVSVSGGAVFGVKFAELSKTEKAEKSRAELSFHHEFDVTFSASGTTDGGLGFGASGGFDSEAGGDVDKGTVYVSMDNHTLTIGDNDAADLVAGGIKDVGFDDIGADDEPEMLNGNSAASLIYTGSFGPASVAISAGADGAGGHDYAAGFNFNIAPVKVGVGFDSNKVMSVGMGISQGAISGNVLYSTTKKHMVMVARPTDLSDDDTVNPTAPTAVAAATLATYFRAPANAPGADITAGPGWSHRTMEGVKSTALGIDISYQLSEGTSVTMVYGQHKVDGYDLTPTVDEDSTGDNKSAIIASETKKSMGIGFSHDLGGGATLKAGAGKNGDENTVADLGITMSF